MRKHYNIRVKVGEDKDLELPPNVIGVTFSSSTKAKLVLSETSDERDDGNGLVLMVNGSTQQWVASTEPIPKYGRIKNLDAPNGLGPEIPVSMYLTAEIVTQQNLQTERRIVR